MLAPIRHLTLKLGFLASILAYTFAPFSALITRFSLTKGVLPMVVVLSSKILDILDPVELVVLTA